MTVKNITYSLEDLDNDFDILFNQIFKLLDQLPFNRWTDPTPAEGWSILDSVGHLAFFDEIMSTALVEPESFSKIKTAYKGHESNLMDIHLQKYRDLGPSKTLDLFKSNHLTLRNNFVSKDLESKIPWFGPEMKTSTALISRIMEYWAHSQDIYDTLKTIRETSNALRYIAELGVKTFKWSFQLNELEEPKDKLFVALKNDGEDLLIGDTSASNKITGSALDFCLLVTQRRNSKDLNLTAVGGGAVTFLDIAQCFAGAKGTRRQPISNLRSD